MGRATRSQSTIVVWRADGERPDLRTGVHTGLCRHHGRQVPHPAVLPSARPGPNTGCPPTQGRREIAIATSDGNRVAPDDRACDDAWARIMEIATTHCLIVQAYSGVATLALPAEQRKAGIRRQVLDTHLAFPGMNDPGLHRKLPEGGSRTRR